MGINRVYSVFYEGKVCMGDPRYTRSEARSIGVKVKNPGSALLLTLAQHSKLGNPCLYSSIGGYERFHPLNDAPCRAVLGHMKRVADLFQAVTPQPPGERDRHIPRLVKHPPPRAGQSLFVDAGSNRVPVDVSHNLHQRAVGITEDRLVSAPKQGASTL